MPHTPWASNVAKRRSETSWYASIGGRRTSTGVKAGDGRWCTTTPMSRRRWWKPSACRRAKKGVVEGRTVAAPALLIALIHRSAWNRNSRKFGVSISPARHRPYTKRDGGKHLLVLPTLLIVTFGARI